VVAPVLQDKLPEAGVYSTVFPQLLVTVTVGTDGMVRGADEAAPIELVQPLTLVVTPYTVAFVTVMEEVVALLLHSNAPVEVVYRKELPQLLISVTVGFAGVDRGLAMAMPAGLTQPPTVWTTE
jgi:hypothetical protein